MAELVKLPLPVDAVSIASEDITESLTSVAKTLEDETVIKAITKRRLKNVRVIFFIEILSFQPFFPCSVAKQEYCYVNTELTKV